MAAKLISIIIPLYNAMPYFRRTIQSILEQTANYDTFEAIIIDDGSTDGSAVVANEVANQHPELFHVIHTQASGGPSRPRNIGLESASSQYVFFLDADDYLGNRAVELMLEHISQWDSDILVVKHVGENGRRAPRSMFRMSQPNANIWTSRVFNTLSPSKLFRRDFLVTNSIRFPEAYKHREDHLFVSEAYFRASIVSVAADYDYCHIVQRDDGENLTKEPYVNFSSDYAICKAMIESMERHEPRPGIGNSVVLPRILKSSWFAATYAACMDDESLQLNRLQLLGDLLNKRMANDAGAIKLPDGLRELVDYVVGGNYQRAARCINMLSMSPDSEFVGVSLERGQLFSASGIPMLIAHSGDVVIKASSALSINDSIESIRRNRRRLQISCKCDYNRFWTEHVEAHLVLRARNNVEEIIIKGKDIHAIERKHIAFSFTIHGLALYRCLHSNHPIWDFYLELREGGYMRRVRFGGHMTDSCERDYEQLPKAMATSFKRNLIAKRTPTGNLMFKQIVYI